MYNDSIVFEESPVGTNRATADPSFERKPVRAVIDLGDSAQFLFQDGNGDVFVDPSYSAIFRRLISKILINMLRRIWEMKLMTGHHIRITMKESVLGLES